MKIKIIGEIPKPSEPEIKKEVVENNELQTNKVSSVRREYFEPPENINSTKDITNYSPQKVFFIFGGIIFLIIVAIIYFQFIYDNESVDNKNNFSGEVKSRNQSYISDEVHSQEKDEELNEQKQNIDDRKNNNDYQEQNSNTNTNIIDGYYQVGNVFCTIKKNSKGITLRWNKGSGYTKLIEDYQGEDVIYTEYDSRGTECGYFYFENGFLRGDYNRKDGSIFQVVKIR